MLFTALNLRSMRDNASWRHATTKRRSEWQRKKWRKRRNRRKERNEATKTATNQMNGCSLANKNNANNREIKITQRHEITMIDADGESSG